MYLEEETSKKSEVISCIFSLNEEVGALAKALRLFEVNLFPIRHNSAPGSAHSFKLLLPPRL